MSGMDVVRLIVAVVQICVSVGLIVWMMIVGFVMAADAGWEGREAQDGMVMGVTGVVLLVALVVAGVWIWRGGCGEDDCDHGVDRNGVGKKEQGK